MSTTPAEPAGTGSQPAASGSGSGAGRSRWQAFAERLRRGHIAAQRLAQALASGVHSRWRRSLQLRVITSTLAISATVTAVIGVFLMQEVLGGVLDAKRDAALTDHQAGLDYAVSELQGTEELDRQLDQIARELSARSGGLYEVMILPSRRGASGRVSGDFSEESVPQQLRAEVHDSPELEQQYYRYTEIADGEGNTVSGLAVGARLSTALEFYYIYPLDQEQEMLALVQRTLLGAAAALLILLAAIASLVTRQVVIPVRRAARSAERLSSGELSERMHVRGEDDLARLAVSFNDMAGNLQEKIRELEELSKVQRQFVSDVSHELRTPLSTIRMAGDLLHQQREDLDTPMQRPVELLHEQLHRFEELLGDLLEISRHDAGAATLSIESADVRDVVMRAVGDAEQIAERRGIKVVLRLPAEPCEAEFEMRRIGRVLRNLIVNAIEHSEGKDVIVTAAGDRDSVAVAVRDFGVGLKEGEEHLCFDRFWRADPARTRTTGGTGLGLPIAREDALLHGGWLQAWGFPGKGSQFRLTLPRRAGTELRGSPLPLAPPETAVGRRPQLLPGSAASGGVASGGAAEESATGAQVEVSES